MVAVGRSRLFLFYVLTSSALIGVITVLQCYKYGVYGTDLLLGWDSPKYVWMAREVLTVGSFSFVGAVGYPHFYVQLLAFLGYVAGSVVVVERALPLIFTVVLIFANARITLRITGNLHVAGLAALLTSVSINTLRLYADLNRNLMALSLSFTSFLLIADFIEHHPVSKKSFLDKTYLSILAVFLVVAGTQLETFLVLALTSIMIGVLSRNWRKLVALALIPAIPTAILLAAFPQLPSRYMSQIGLFTRELPSSEVLLWTGGSWLVFSLLVAGAAYMFYQAVRQKNTLASAIFSWTTVITLLFILTVQRAISLSAEYAFRALLILPVPVLFATVVFAFGNSLKDTFLEIGVSSSAKRYAFKISLRHVALVITTLTLVTSSIMVTSQHYDQFLTPYVMKPGYGKIQIASDFLNEKGFSKPIVLVCGEHASWFGGLYSSYLGAEIGSHYYYKGDVNSLLHFSASESQYTQTATFAIPILLIAPYLYGDEIPYYLTRYHIGQGIYVVPPHSLISRAADYGPSVSVTADNILKEVKSEYLYADQDDPSLIVLRVTTKGYTSYTFENYPQNWAFLKLEQGGALSYPENDPRRFDGTSAINGNDPAESTQFWSTSQTGTISVEDSLAKEGQANLKVEGSTDSWGNLGFRYNPQGTWDLSHKSSLAVWAKASANAPFSITLSDSTGNTRTYWDIQPDGASAATRWKRFAINLNEYTSQNGDFDLSRVDSVDFYAYSNPGRVMTLWIDDPIIDDALTWGSAIFKARILREDKVTLYFWTRLS